MTLIAFETLKQPDGVDAFVQARRKSPLDIAKEVGTAYHPASSASALRRKLLIMSTQEGDLLKSRQGD